MFLIQIEKLRSQCLILLLCTTFAACAGDDSSDPEEELIEEDTEMYSFAEGNYVGAWSSTTDTEKVLMYLLVQG